MDTEKNCVVVLREPLFKVYGPCSLEEARNLLKSRGYVRYCGRFGEYIPDGFTKGKVTDQIGICRAYIKKVESLDTFIW